MEGFVGPGGQSARRADESSERMGGQTGRALPASVDSLKQAALKAWSASWLHGMATQYGCSKLVI